MNQGEKIQSLYAQFGQIKGISIELYKRLIAISVKNDAATATIFLQGAQLAEYKKKGQEPLLWLSEQCDYQVGSPLRGGVPVCWPWFGDISRNPDAVKQQVIGDDLPAHGLVRSVEWELVEINLLDKNTTQLILSLDVQPSEQWPYAARLQLEVTVGTELTLQLSVTNKSEKSFTFTSALHTYLNISDITQVQVKGLEHATYLDTLDNWSTQSSTEPLSVKGELDSVYTNISQSVLVEDKQWNRSISLQGINAPDLVAWNPWIKKSQALSQFADTDYQQMLCLESAHLLDNAQLLNPEEQFTFGVQIGSGRLL